MATIEQDVARHYAREGLEAAILDGLRALGRAPESVIAPEDLGPVDEFHIGGHQATIEFFEQLDLKPGTAVLDIGSGIGGPARTLAHRYGCRVTGIDLTPDYVAVAESLTRRVGLADRVAFRAGSALDLPFAPGGFDVATLLHVGMNVPDKPALAAGVHRVLRPGGAFAVYDVMRTGEGELSWPVPWAATPATSFLATPAEYRAALEGAGFVVTAQRERRDFAIEFFRRMRARMAESGPPPLGLHLLMGATAPAKVANMVANLEAGRIAPVEMIARRA